MTRIVLVSIYIIRGVRPLGLLYPRLSAELGRLFADLGLLCNGTSVLRLALVGGL